PVVAAEAALVQVVFEVERGLGGDSPREPRGDVVPEDRGPAGRRDDGCRLGQRPGALAEGDRARDEVLLGAARPLRVRDDGGADGTREVEAELRAPRLEITEQLWPQA